VTRRERFDRGEVARVGSELFCEVFTAEVPTGFAAGCERLDPVL
jgi:hypothetical protein